MSEFPRLFRISTGGKLRAAVDLSGYKPEVGDIAVFPAVPGTRLEYGHIEMFTGERWQSDYIQPQKPNDASYGNGFFANQIWAAKPFTIFRKRGLKWRSEINSVPTSPK
jgi:hypothetical protein